MSVPVDQMSFLSVSAGCLDVCTRNENDYRHIPGTADEVNNRPTEKQKQRTLQKTWAALRSAFAVKMVLKEFW